METAALPGHRIEAEPSRYLAFVEASTQRLLDQNAFLVAAGRGLVKMADLEMYLNNLRFLFKSTIPSLKMAASAAYEQGHDRLGDFYAKKVGEEAGHEKWAEADLDTNALELFEENQQATPSFRRLVEYSRSLTRHSPELFLSYVLFLEYFTVLAGPEFLRRLEEECGITRQQVTALYNHVMLDQQHAAEDNGAIAEMIQETKLADDALAALEEIERIASAALGECLVSPHYAS